MGASVTSGALALLLPYAKLRKRGSDQLVLPLPNRSYEVIKERFADPPLTKSFASPAAAERDKLVAQKRRKGYG